MIYNYDDIVKTTEEEYRFIHLSRNDIGKCITVSNKDAGTVFGGIIRHFDKDNITFEAITADENICWKSNVRCLTAKELFRNPYSKVAIYDASSGNHYMYKARELVWNTCSERKFNTDILKPNSKFYMEADGRCGIVTVLDCGKDRLCLKEEGFIGGIRYFSIDETTYGSTIKAMWNPIQLKTIDEITCYDLVKRGFNGYGLKPSTVFEIIKILESEEVKPVE